MRFEWDAAKATGNFAKHSVSFEEAATVFDDANRVEDYDVTLSTRPTKIAGSSPACRRASGCWSWFMWSAGRVAGRLGSSRRGRQPVAR